MCGLGVLLLLLSYSFHLCDGIEKSVIQGWANSFGTQITQTIDDTAGAKKLAEIFQQTWNSGNGKVFSAGESSELLGQLEEIFQDKQETMVPGVAAVKEAFKNSKAEVDISCSDDISNTPRCVDLEAFQVDNFIENIGPATTDHSTVSFAPGMDKADPEVQKHLDATFDLEAVWKKNDADHRTGELSHRGPVLLQYFGSQTGLMRWYPGRPAWRSPLNFDPRERPWYVVAASGPKKVVLVLDRSGSMNTGTRWADTVLAAKTVLDTLTVYDWVNVVLFSSEAESLECFGQRLVRATPANVMKLTGYIESELPKGGTNFGTGLELAFDMLDANTDVGCNPLILFMTDGKDTIDKDGSQNEELVRTRNERHGGAVKVFAYGVSKEASDDAPERIARAASGVYQKIVDSANLKSVMSQYYQYLARGAEQTYSFSSPYMDASGGGLMISLVYPIFDEGCTPPVFSGVLATDVMLRDVLGLAFYESTSDQYVTLISENGQVLTHPSIISPNDPRLAGGRVDNLQWDNFVYVDIANLEVAADGKSFDKIRNKILKRETFTETMKAKRLKQAGGAQRDGATEVEIDVTYICQPVQFSGLEMCEVIERGADQDIKWTWPEGKTKPEVWYHRVDVGFGGSDDTALAKKTDSSLVAGDVKFLGVQYSVYQTMQHGTVVTPARVWRNGPKYIQNVARRYQKRGFDQKEIEETNRIQDYLNGGVNWNVTQLKPNILSTVLMTAELEQHWKDVYKQEDHRFLYLGLENGILRVFPGINVLHLYDPTQLTWYKKMRQNPTKSVLTTQTESFTGKRVLTAGRAITYNCNGNCDKILGVLAVDWSFADIQRQLQRVSGGKCKEYSAATTQPEIVAGLYDCFLIDSSGYLLHHPRFFSNANDSTEYFIGDFRIGSFHLLDVAGLLRAEQYLKSKHLVDFSEERDINYFSLELTQAKSMTLPGTCEHGTAVIAPVPNTNVYLLAIEDFRTEFDVSRAECRQPTPNSDVVNICSDDYQRGFESTIPGCTILELTEKDIETFGEPCNPPKVGRSAKNNAKRNAEDVSGSSGADDDGSSASPLVAIILGCLFCFGICCAGIILLWSRSRGKTMSQHQRQIGGNTTTTTTQARTFPEPTAPPPTNPSYQQPGAGNAW